MRHAIQLGRPVLIPTIAALASGIFACSAAIIVLKYMILTAWHNDHEVRVPLARFFGYLISVANNRILHIGLTYWLVHPLMSFGEVITSVSGTLDALDIRQRLNYVMQTACVAGVLSTIVSFAFIYCLSPPIDRTKHIRGRRLIEGAAARRFFNRAEGKAVRATGSGLFLTRGMRMARQRETRHFMLMGATGSGKTVIIRTLLAQIFQRGDRVILHDTKGDMTATMPGNDFLLLAPHDARSAAWNIAADVNTPQTAREFAASFIPASQEPMWSAGAREIVVGAIIALQKRFPDDWDWYALQDYLFSPVATLRKRIERFYPEALEYLALDANDSPTKTTVSFIVTARAHLAGTLLPLAAAWPDQTDEGNRTKFSIKAWLADETVGKRTIILQRAAHFPDLSACWIRAFVTNAANYAVSPLLPDSDQRRIWFCLDEFPQLGKIEGFQQILEVGRSRGICAVVGIQDPHQLQHLYGSDVARSWQSSIGTKILCRMEASASADAVRNEIIGKRTVAWTTKTTSSAPWHWDGSGGGTTRSQQMQHEETDVVSSAYLETELGWHGGWQPTIRALVAGSGRGPLQGILRCEWPIEPWPAVRPAIEPATWTQ